MFRILTILALLAATAGAAAAQDWQWRKFTPPDGAFSLLAPGPLTPDDEARRPNAAMGSYAYSDFYGYFGLVFRDWSPSFWTIKPDRSNHFKKVRRDFVKASGGELVSEEKFARGDLTGRNVKIRIPYGQMTGFEGRRITKYRFQRLRMFFVGNRFYLLIAVLPADIVDTPAVDKFFDSFAAR